MGLIASDEGLRIVENERLKKNWACQDPKWCSEAKVEVGTLKRFRGGKTAISQVCFQGICNALGVDWERVVDWEKSRKNRVDDNSELAQIYLKEDCNEMPDVQVFYGREKELEDLKQSILQNRSRVVTLCGSPGIGKTALAAKLTEEVKSDFEYFSWRSLNYSPPPTLLKLLSGLIEFLSSEEEIYLPSNVDDLIAKLLKIFATRRVLLVLDGWENILRIQSVEAFRTDYDKYGELLRLVAERKHQSCVVITTQEEPKELSLLKDTPPVNLIRLAGLDFEAGLKILEAKQLKFTRQQAIKLITKDYSGNPLALFHVCEHIQRVFAGSVTQYENYHTFIVPLSVEVAINENCKFLSDLEAEILQIIAKEPTPIDYEKLKSKIPNTSQLSNSDLQTTLSSLLMRSLIERSSQGNEILYSVQSVIRKCIHFFYRIS
jgi:hypothetical protein